MSEETKNSIQDDEIDLRELILTLWKGKWIILGVTFVVTLATFFYVKSLPDKYTVVTKAVIPSSGGNSKMSGLAALAGVDMGSGGGEVDLMQHVDVVVKNSYFMDKLLEKKWFVEGDSITLEEFLEVEKDSSVDNWQYVHKMKMYGMIRNSKIKMISVANEAGILELRTEFKSPEMAYQVNVFLKDLLIGYFKNTYKTKDSENVAFVKERLNEVSQKLEKSENALAVFKKKNIMSQSPIILLEEKRLERKIELNLQMYKEVSKQYELARIEEKKQQPILEIIQGPELPIGPSGPNRKVYMLISFFLGCVLGVFVLLVKTWIVSLVLHAKYIKESVEHNS